MAGRIWPPDSPGSSALANQPNPRGQFQQDIPPEGNADRAVLAVLSAPLTCKFVVGVLGLSLNEHPHRFTANGASFTTWCAEDALFLPLMLDQTATVESYSPLSKEKVRLTVGPEGVEEVSPAGAVLSIVTLDPSVVDTSSGEAIYGNFCEQIHFFASRDEAEGWAAGRENIDIISVEEGYELGKLVFSEVLAYA